MGDVYALFDISSDGVTGSLVQFAKNASPHILYTHKEPVVFPKSDLSRIIKITTSALNHCLEVLEKEGLPKVPSHYHSFHFHKVEQVHCFFSSPWFLSQTRTIKVKKDAPFVVTQQYVQDLIKADKEVFIQELLENKKSSLSKDAVDIIDTKILSVKLNGYHTNFPYKKVASEVKLTVFASVAGKSLVNSVREILGKQFGSKTIQFHTFPLAFFSTIRDSHGLLQDFLTVDVAAEVTDMCIVKNGILKQVVTIPVGKNLFTRSLIEKLKISIVEAESLFELYAQDKVVDTIAKKVTTAFEEVKDTWHGIVFQALSENASDLFIPETIYCTSNSRILPFFIKLFQDQQLGQLQVKTSPVLVSGIDHEIISGFCDVQERCPEDPITSIESVFIDRIRVQ